MTLDQLPKSGKECREGQTREEGFRDQSPRPGRLRLHWKLPAWIAAAQTQAMVGSNFVGKDSLGQVHSSGGATTQRSWPGTVFW